MSEYRNETQRHKQMKHKDRNVENISRVPDQNGVSPLHIMLEIHHSGREPSIYEWSAYPPPKLETKAASIHTFQTQQQWENASSQIHSVFFINYLSILSSPLCASGSNNIIIFINNIIIFSHLRWGSAEKNHCKMLGSALTSSNMAASEFFKSV